MEIYQNGELSVEMRQKIIAQHLYLTGNLAITQEVISEEIINTSSQLELNSDGTITQSVVGVIQIPAGTEANRPQIVPPEGRVYLYFNSDNYMFEAGFDGGAGVIIWATIPVNP